MTAERKERFFEVVKQQYNEKKNLVIAVSEGVRWWDDATKQLSMVYASSETDEYGHKRFGGVSGVIASEISKRLNIPSRSQISGYYPRSGFCCEYDRQLTSALADKVLDLLIRQLWQNARNERNFSSRTTRRIQYNIRRYGKYWE